MQEPSGLTGDVGDKAGFVAFYQAEYPGAVRLATVLTLSVELAEDVVQEAFARIYRRFALLERPGAYLRVTVVNVVREGHRRRERERRHLVRLGPPAISVAAETDHLADVLGGLPLRQRSVLVLRYWADWPDAQIAEALRCRPGTVRSLAARGLRALSKELS